MNRRDLLRIATLLPFGTAVLRTPPDAARLVAKRYDDAKVAKCLRAHSQFMKDHIANCMKVLQSGAMTINQARAAEGFHPLRAST